LDGDDQLALELDVCRAYQIPHSTFLAWSKDDRDKAIWQYVRELQRCASCGTRPDEWHESKGGRRDAYEAVLYVCPGCEQREIKAANLEGKTLPKGHSIRLIRRRR